MRTLRPLRIATCLTLLLGFILTQSTTAQVRIPDSAIVTVAELNEILAAGKALERQKRWGEAATYYEDALRENPGESVLEHRLTLARTHYDIVRRYADQSYLKSQTSLTERQTLDLYSEVLLKIHSHYVNAPSWRELVEQGLVNIEVATLEPAFIERHLANVDPKLVSGFRQQLRQQVDPRRATDRHTARQLAWTAAYLGEQQLGIPKQAVLLEFVCGSTGALDDYSAFLTPSQLDEVFSQIEGNFVGLGLELKTESNHLAIVSVIPGGPAAQAGIKGGDKIIAVDGHLASVATPDRVADMLRGAEHSLVNVTVVKGDGEEQQHRLTRRRVEVPSLEQIKLLDQRLGIAYIKLTSFQKTTTHDFDQALWSLHRQGMRSLIVDVRGNPGGLLNSAVEVADKFLNEGTIVSTRGRNKHEDFDFMAHAVGTWRVPLIVLIDENSASASEIFAAAISDHRRGMIIGQRSYGKGSVQGIFPLNVDSSGIRLTTAKFYAPKGQPISRRGVKPSIVVQATNKPTADGKTIADATLNRAVREAKTHLGGRP